MAAVPENLPVIDNEAASQYEVRVDGHLAVLQYIRRQGRVVLVHTGVPKAIEGRGIAGQLARHALDDARSRGEAVEPRCPFVQAFLDRHPDYQDLVASS